MLHSLVNVVTKDKEVYQGLQEKIVKMEQVYLQLKEEQYYRDHQVHKVRKEMMVKKESEDLQDSQVSVVKKETWVQKAIKVTAVVTENR